MLRVRRTKIGNRLFVSDSAEYCDCEIGQNSVRVSGKIIDHQLLVQDTRDQLNPLSCFMIRSTKDFRVYWKRNPINLPARFWSDQKCGEAQCWGAKLSPDVKEQPKPIKKITTAALKRGTGGRSSFSGIVATVFGSSGFLGRYVVNRLGKIGTQLILPYRGDFDDMRRLKLAGDLGQVLYRPFNLKDEDSICKAVMYSNTVINLIGRDWETKNYKFQDVHVEGAARLARICKTMGVEKFIHVSALNACESPQAFMTRKGSEFLASKWEGEEAVKQEFPEAIIFRPSNMVGAEDRFSRYFASNYRHNLKWLGLYKKGEETEKQPVYVSDVAQGIVEAAKCRRLQGETFQAIGPRRYYLSELVDWFHRIMKKDDCHDWGYKRYDLRWDPFMKLRISLLPMMTLGNPFGNLTWESVERECHSDEVDPSIKTLLDLGVEPMCIENIVPWVLKPYTAWAYYEYEVHEFEEPDPPSYLIDDTASR